jgi:hypothetical protein
MVRTLLNIQLLFYGMTYLMILEKLTILTNLKTFYKFYLKSVNFITIQHKLSRAFQTDMHNKLHKLNTAQ